MFYCLLNVIIVQVQLCCVQWRHLTVSYLFPYVLSGFDYLFLLWPSQPTVWGVPRVEGSCSKRGHFHRVVITHVYDSRHSLDSAVLVAFDKWHYLFDTLPQCASIFHPWLS